VVDVVVTGFTLQFRWSTVSLSKESLAGDANPPPGGLLARPSALAGRGRQRVDVAGSHAQRVRALGGGVMSDRGTNQVLRSLEFMSFAHVPRPGARVARSSLARTTEGAQGAP
jgi:hypothetical protein